MKTARSFRQLVEAWNGYWFPTTAGLRLAVCRIIVLSTQLIWFFPTLQLHLDFLRLHDGFRDPQFMLDVICQFGAEDWVRQPEVVAAINLATFTVGILALIGFCTRASCLIHAVGYIFLVSHEYSYGEVHHPEALTAIFLLLLGLGDSGRCLSLDAWLAARRETSSSHLLHATTRDAMWPLLLIQTLIGLAYLDAGLSKLYTGGFQWLNGYTLQGYLLGDGLEFHRPLGVWLSQQYLLCVFLSVFAVVLEVGFVAALIWRRLLPAFLLAGVLLHAGIYLTQGAPFQQLIILYCAFIPFDKGPLFKILARGFRDCDEYGTSTATGAGVMGAV